MAGKFHAKVPGMMQSSSKVISKELLRCGIAGQTTPHFPCLPKEFGKDWWRWSCCPFTHGMTPQNRDLQCLTTLALAHWHPSATLWPGIDQCYIPQHGPMAQSHLCSSWAWGGQWEFQDPKMEVLYHLWPYFVEISPHTGLTWALYVVGTSNQSIPGH